MTNKTPMDAEKSKKIVGGIIVLLIACVFISRGGSNTSVSPTQNTSTTKSIGVGEEGYLKKDEVGTRLFIARTEEALDEFTKSATANDTVGINQILTSGQAFMIEAGVKVLVIEQKFGKRQIRILEGSHETQTGWIYAEFVSKTK